jgi:hypothetical protein
MPPGEPDEDVETVAIDPGFKQPLAALRAQPQIGLRPFRPGETSISQKAANSPARPRSIGAQV